MEQPDWNLVSLNIMRCLFRMKTSVEKAVAPAVQKYGLTSIGTAVLFLVRFQEKPTISSINRCLKMNQGNLSTLCKKLERSGFLTRTRDLEDERVVRLALTQYGEEAIEAVKQELHRFENILAEFQEEETLQAVEGLNCFTDFMERVCDRAGTYTL